MPTPLLKEVKIVATVQPDGSISIRNDDVPPMQLFTIAGLLQHLASQMMMAQQMQQMQADGLLRDIMGKGMGKM